MRSGHSLATYPLWPSVYQRKAECINSLFGSCGGERGNITSATVAHGMGPEHVGIELEFRVSEFEEMAGAHDFTVAPAGSPLATRQWTQYSAILAMALTLPPERAAGIWNSHVARWPRNSNYPLWSVDA